MLITGGAGFVGSHLADALLLAGCEVRVLDSFERQVHSGTSVAGLRTGYEVLRGDILDNIAVARALSDVDVVFHFASAVGVGQSMYEAARYTHTNAVGTATLLEQILAKRSKIERLILASSMSLYGEGDYSCGGCGFDQQTVSRTEVQLERKQWDPFCSRCGSTLEPRPTREEAPLRPTSIYALTKRYQEDMSLIFCRTYSIPIVALRFFNVYGTRQSLANPYTGVIAMLTSQLLSRSKPILFEDGAQSRDFIHVSDVVAANLLAMRSNAAVGEIINVGSGVRSQLVSIAHLLAKSLRSSLEPVVSGSFRVGDIRHCWADISKARAILKFEPSVSLDDGIQELVEWTRNSEAIDNVPKAMGQLTRYGLLR